jgi:hypothetical protein
MTIDPRLAGTAIEIASTPRRAWVTPRLRHLVASSAESGACCGGDGSEGVS